MYNKGSTKEGSHSEMPVGETMPTYNWTSRDLETMPDNGKLMALQQTGIVYENDILQSPYLPGFRYQAREVFADIL